MQETTTRLPPFAEASRLLSVKETMALLSVRSRTSLWRYTKLGLRPVRFGDKQQSPTKFRFDEVMYWLEGLKR